MTSLPTGPHGNLAPFTAVAERSLPVFGAPATLMFVPSRRERRDAAGPDRPAFRPSRARSIIEEEQIWRGSGLVLTPNRFPFARDQRILWPDRPLREPDEPMWAAANEWADAAGGSVLVNTVGAAATIGRAHAHLLPERSPFLSALRLRPASPTLQRLIELPAGAELLVADVPCCLLGVRGPAAARAEALVRLGEARLCPAWNVVVQDNVAWVYPRRLETPAPSFPFALGAAELWGRWCYVDEGPFHEATTHDLEQALVLAGAEILS